jgi:hypothetical protein
MMMMRTDTRGPGRGSARAGARSGVALALGLAILAGAAAASPVATDEPDLSAALAEASRKLFGASVGASPVVTRTGGLERFSEGYDYDVYEVRGGGPGGRPVRLLRLQVHPDASSQIDLAIRYEGGRILAIAPIRPVVLEGKAFVMLPELFRRLGARPVREFAAGLSRFFHGLEFLEAGAAGPRPVPSAAPSAAPAFFSARQSTLAAGSAVPQFSGRTLTGAAVTSRSLDGRPALVVLGSLRRAKAHEAIETCARLARRNPALALLAVVPQRAIDAMPLLPPALAGWLAERTIADEDGTVARSFKVPVTPYLVSFDSGGHLVAQEAFAGLPALERRIASLVAGRPGGPAGTASPAPPGARPRRPARRPSPRPLPSLSPVIERFLDRGGPPKPRSSPR